MPNPTQENREFEIVTPLGKDVLLVKSFTFQEQLGQMFSLELELLSTDISIDFESLLGQNTTTRIDMQKDQVRFINGYITQFSQVEHTRGFATYHATVSPWLWFLTRTADCRIFQHQIVPDIIKEVFEKNGYTDYEVRLKGDYREWEYCVQYRETDFNFVSRLMEQEGIYYYFEHENGKHTLILCDKPSAHKLIPNYTSIPFYPFDSTAVRVQDEYIHNWSINKSIQPGSYVLEEYNFKKPMADLLAQSTSPEGHKTDDFEIFDYPGEYTESSEGATYAKIRLEELHAGYEKKQGASNVRGLFAGGLFSLEKFSREDQNREYLVTSVTHSAQQDIYTTNSSGDGNIYNNSFTLIESDRKFRTPRVTPKPIIQGLQTATVVGEDGDEIYTDEYGRIKCQFHWDRYGQFNQDSSCWIRVKHSWAGDKWGTIYIPRVGHEVVVEFLEGDPDRPLVTGEVYNKDKMPPYDLPANKTQSGTKSRSTKGGSSANFNEIRMEDKKGKEQLYIHAEKNQDNVVENDETTKVGHNRTENVGNNETITIMGDRTETVGAGGDGDETITITGDRTEIVGDGANGGDEKLTVRGDRIREVKNDETITIGENLHITAGDEIILTVGKSSLKMYKNGNIELSGINITIKGDATITEKAGMITSEASGSNTMKGGVVTSEATAVNTVKGAIVTLNP